MFWWEECASEDGLQMIARPALLLSEEVADWQQRRTPANLRMDRRGPTTLRTTSYYRKPQSTGG
jgi:hypothetical protein